MCFVSDFELSSTTDLSFDPEMPPDGLYVEFQYTSGGIMSRYDVWSAITESIASVALLMWNAEIMGSLITPVTPDVAIRFVSSVNPPRYQSKTIIWTLVEAFDFYNAQRHYSDCFLRTHIGRDEATQNLGVASIKSTMPTLPGLRTNSSVLSFANETSSELNSSTLALGTSKQASFNRSLLSNTDSSILQHDSQRTSNLQAGHLSLYLEYLNPAAPISDKGFVTLIINILVFAAQHDPKDAPSGLVRAYNSLENYTFTIGPTSHAARYKLPWELAITALGYLPTEMMRHGREGRWAELQGRIKWDGAWVGRILILKGDHRVSSSASCEIERFGVEEDS